MTTASHSITVADPLGRALRIAVLLVPVALCVALYWDSVAPLIDLWQQADDTRGYSHGFLIVAISAWLLARQAQSLPPARSSRPEVAAIAAVLAASFLWLLLWRAGIQTAHELLLPLIFWLATWAICGREVARRAWFAFAFLTFAVPVWDGLAIVLQPLTVAVVARLLPLAHVPASLDGNLVHLPSGTFEIAAGCSGTHFVAVGLAIGALQGELRGDTVRTRALLIALAVALSIASNWIRVLTIIVAGYVTHMQHYIVRVEHYSFGWLVFALTLVAYFVLARHIESPEPTGASEEVGDPIGNDVPAQGRVRDQPYSFKAWLLCMAITLPCLSFGPVWGALAERQAPARVAAELASDPSGLWTGPGPAPATWRPEFPGADVQRLGAYRKGGREISAFVAAYATQAHGKKLVGYGVSVLPAGELPVSQGVRALPVAAEGSSAGGAVGVFIEIESAGRGAVRSLIWTRYEVGSRKFTSGLRAQMWYGVVSLFHPTPSRVMALRAVCDTDCAQARRDMEEFARASHWLD